MFRGCGGIAQIHVVGCRGGGGAVGKEGYPPSRVLLCLWWPLLPIVSITSHLNCKGKGSQFRSVVL